MKHCPHTMFLILAIVAGVVSAAATKNIAFGVAVFFGLAAIVIPILSALRDRQSTDTKDN